MLLYIILKIGRNNFCRDLKEARVLLTFMYVLINDGWLLQRKHNVQLRKFMI